MPTATPFNNLITFSRGSNATVTGSNGLIQWAPNNLLTFSEQFDNAAWTKNATTVSANSTVAPDGTSTADTVTPSTANSAHNIYASFTYTAATHTFSVYVKPNGYNWVKLGSMFTGQGVFFDVSNGVVGTQNAGYTGTITAAGNGWYRCAVTQTAAAGADLPGLYVASSGSVVSFAGDGTSGILIWGAQLELGPTATTYNPTTVKNLLGFSEAFDNAAWTKTAASIITGAAANPINNLFNAQKLMEDTSTGIHRILQAVTIAAAPHTLSFYAKPAGRDWLYIYANGGSQTAFVNVATGAVGPTVGSPTVTMTSVGSGWYRAAITFPNAITTSQNLQVWLASNSTTNSYTGDGNSGVYIYGAQLSDSASLDPYVPTPGAAPSSTAFYGPRFDFDPVTLQPRGLLVEEQRTNLALYSEQFNDAYWTKNGSTITANSGVAPDGTTTADLMILTANEGRVQRNITTTSNSASIYVKFVSGTGLFAIDTNGGVAADKTLFNLNTGAVVSTGAANSNSTITPVGNGWYRVSTARGLTTGLTLFFGLATGSLAGDQLLIWGAQLEAGAFATSYIPTVASTVTRSADIANMTGSLFSQWYGQSEGTFVISTSPIAVDNDIVFSVSNSGGYNNSIYFPADSGSQFIVVNGGAVQANIDAGTVTANTTNKIAGAYRASNFAASVGGGAVVATTSGTIPTVDRAVVGGLEVNTANRFNGHIRSIDYIPARAADFQLQALST